MHPDWKLRIKYDIPDFSISFNLVAWGLVTTRVIATKTFLFFILLLIVSPKYVVISQVILVPQFVLSEEQAASIC